MSLSLVVGGLVVLGLIVLAVVVVPRLRTLSRAASGKVSVVRVIWDDTSGYTAPDDWHNVAGHGIELLKEAVEGQREDGDRFGPEWRDNSLRLKLINEFVLSGKVPAEPALDDSADTAKERDHRNRIRKAMAFQIDDAIIACRRNRNRTPACV